MERAGALADVSGLPPSYIQVFGWLVVCDPPHQSVEELRQTLGLSAGAISMATAALMRMGIVERIAQPGRRRLFYRLHPAAWERVLRLRLEALSQARAAAEDALAQAPEPQSRLAGMRDMYAWFESRITDLLAGGDPPANRR